MNENFIHQLRSELYLAHAYVERGFQAIIDFGELSYHPKVRQLTEEHFPDLAISWEEFSGKFLDRKSMDFSPNDSREFALQVYKNLESILVLPLKCDSEINAVIKIINQFYRIGHEVHRFCLIETDFLIDLPRSVAVKKLEVEPEFKPFLIVEDEELDDHANEVIELEDLQLIQISEELLEENTENGASILSFNGRRQKEFKFFIKCANDFIYEKNYTKALYFFERARMIEENGEVLTLIGWCYSLMGKLKEAKSYCIKSIEIDPEYGAAYNDIGTYLLQEGDVAESIRWFELAKRPPFIKTENIHLSIWDEPMSPRKNIVRHLN